ncbi:YicC/YloC family endoribonuclease [Oceanobacter sp. 3_MG-2023]|uniref:YicC/YloC family endoribonuclease n=1 Tax=Oceanobacter sp. 3_MG-2023 TaxID=3062622 RepID=UPI002732B3B6|nr:YicC/YloC family endoribonuclease [Oceanobacter sp. 3_MG-2023]MDP2505577.1 YicC/YloC family endoribonuclease [Oceanobacter sp. 3_MG-2023]
MVYSMTAFARQQADTPAGQIVWEIRSVNHRYLEPQLRLPDNFRELEPALRERLKKQLGRGKVECQLRLQPNQQQSALNINERLLENLSRTLDTIATKIPDAAPANLLDILQWPGLMKTPPVDTQAIQQITLQAFDDCLTNLSHSRAQEGLSLASLIQQRLIAMDTLVATVEAHLPEALTSHHQQLQQRLADMLGARRGSANPERLEQEMVILAQKADVTEELDRLRTHIQETQNILQRTEPVGRRLDFMMQELNREANTLSSKSLTSTTTQAAIEMKVLIEQMREQVQNIE